MGKAKTASSHPLSKVLPDVRHATEIRAAAVSSGTYKRSIRHAMNGAAPVTPNTTLESQEIPMSRLSLACLALAVTAGAALAADAKIDAAVKTFEQVVADEAKLKTYCAMNKLMNDVGDDDAKAQAAEAQMDAFMKDLGPEVEAAMMAGDTLDEKSPDLGAYDAAITKLDEKCPG
jgi:hypothetical protein